MMSLLRRAAVGAVAALGLASAVQMIAPAVSAQGPDRVDVLITFATTPGPADQALVRGAAGTVRYSFHLVPGIAATLPSAAVGALRANPRIQAIEPDGRVEAIDAELDLAWGVKRIGSGEGHDGFVTGANARVAVVDSGIDYRHTDLAGAYAGGYDFVNADDDPLDDNGHGTHVSGTIAAADDGAGVVGVAPGARLYGLKILDAAGSGSWSHAIAALQWAVDHGVHVANHSYGASTDPGTLVAQAFTNSAAAGVLHVAAAGNTGNCGGKGNSIGFPARYPEVIAVGATDTADRRPCFSSTGPDLELATPGVSIVSTYPNQGYASASGTSMASPHVAGAVALLVSVGIVNPIEVRQILMSTATDLGAAGRDTQFGFGLVSVVAALEAAGPVEPAVNVSLTTDQSTYADTDTTAVLTAVVTDERGAPIAGIGFGSFTTTLDGLLVSATFLEDSSTPGTYTAMLDISAAGAGTHTVSVEAANAGLTGSDAASFTVSPPSSAATVHVPSIVYSSSGGRDGKRNVYITVHVSDGDGAAVANATVAVVVYVNGGAWASASGATAADGSLTFEAKNAPSGTYYTEISDVQAGTLVWDGATPPNSFTK